jgi:PRTRC genetic system protein E
MIKEISHLILAKSHSEVQLIVRSAEVEGEIRLCMYPKLSEQQEEDKTEEEVNLLSKPIVISGTPEELDECAWDLITEHSAILAEGVDKVEGIQKEMDALVEKKKKEAAQKTRKPTKTPAKKAHSKPKPKTKAAEKEEARDNQDKAGQGDLFEETGDRMTKEPEPKKDKKTYDELLQDL